MLRDNGSDAHHSYWCYGGTNWPPSTGAGDSGLNIKFHENPSSASGFHADGRTAELRTDMMKVIVACRNFANASKTHSEPTIVMFLLCLS